MSETKFTPGEWRVDKPADSNGYVYVLTEAGEEVCVCYSTDADKYAAFIAACPKLLAACEAIVTLGQGYGQMSHVIAQAEVAIKEATSVREAPAASTPPGIPKSVAATAKAKVADRVYNASEKILEIKKPS